MASLNARTRYTVETRTYSYATKPAYYYVWDAKNSAQVGGNFATPEAAQEYADIRNRAAAETQPEPLNPEHQDDAFANVIGVIEQLREDAKTFLDTGTADTPAEAIALAFDNLADNIAEGDEPLMTFEQLAGLRTACGIDDAQDAR
jgi:hypothetical protein